MLIANLGMASISLDSAWQVALNVIGITIWLAMVVLLVVRWRQGRHMTGWDWAAVVAFATVGGVYLPIGPAVWFFVNSLPSSNLDRMRNEDRNFRWPVCLVAGLVLGLVTTAEAVFTDTIDLVGALFALYLLALAAIRHPQSVGPHADTNEDVQPRL